MRAGYLRQLLSRPAHHLTTAALTYIEAHPMSSPATGWLDLAAKTLVACGAIPRYPPRDGDKDRGEPGGHEERRAPALRPAVAGRHRGHPGGGEGGAWGEARGGASTTQLALHRPTASPRRRASPNAHLDHKVAAKTLYCMLTSA